MQVIYKEAIADKIFNAVALAKAKERIIDYIELERYEWEELKNSYFIYPCKFSNADSIGTFLGVNIRVRD